ncbi:MAG TPA: PilZ domain-containing protein [Gemmataceae bacterium]|nr:PilZ domain-containing protein [Gemmataceae bacterium]
MADSADTPTGAARKPQVSERRAWVRYPPRRLEMLWHLFGMKPPEQRQARIQDISTQGIGLIVDRAFAQGSVLVLRLPGTSLDSRPLLVRVKHLQPLPSGEFKAGCTFVVPLSDAQLAQLI